MLLRMTARALFRLRLPDGSVRLASGSPEAGPTTLLDPAASLDALLAAGDGELWDRVAAAAPGRIPSRTMPRSSRPSRPSRSGPRA